MKEKYPFQKQWEDYRRRRNRQYIIGIVCVLTPGLLVFTLFKSGMESNRAILIYLLAESFALIVFFAVMFKFHKWICPNCGKRFFVKSFWIRFPELLPNCTNCSLQKYKGSTFEQSQKLNKGDIRI